jgi:hypothetical protein
MARKTKAAQAQAPEAPEGRTIIGRVMNGAGVLEPIPVSSLAFFPASYHSPVEAESSRRWFSAVQNGIDVPFIPNLFRTDDGRYAVISWVAL